MKILVHTNNKNALEELISGSNGIDWIHTENIGSFINSDEIDAYFDLSENISPLNYSAFRKPVFINSVSGTLKKINAAANVTRINGWAGFLKRTSWEVAGEVKDESMAVLKALNKKIIVVPDEPGFVSARIIAMIINEAYFAKQDDISTEKEIDIAMKLGTNYPYGPFEWAKMIGIKNIYSLLKVLSEKDSRYKPSSLLEKEAMKI